MAYGGIIGQSLAATNDYFTKDQTLSSTTQGKYPTPNTIPDNIFGLLSQSALYKTELNTVTLNTLNEGDIIYLNENGVPVPFYVANLNYESSYNTRRVLVVRKNSPQSGYWNTSATNTYNGSTLDSWLNTTYFNKLDSAVQTAISTTNIPYTPMGGTTTVSRISKAVFQLSATELGISGSNLNVEGSPLPIANYLTDCTSDDDSFGQYLAYQWTRSPNTSGTTSAFVVTETGRSTSLTVNGILSNAPGYRPAFTLPTDYQVVTGTGGLFDIFNNLLLTLPININPSTLPGGATQIVTGMASMNSQTENTNIVLGFKPSLVILYSSLNNQNELDGNDNVDGAFVPVILTNAYVNNDSTSYSTLTSTGFQVRKSYSAPPRYFYYIAFR